MWYSCHFSRNGGNGGSQDLSASLHSHIFHVNDSWCCWFYRASFSFVTDSDVFLKDLKYKQPLFAYMNTCKENTLEIHFIYLSNKEICCTFKTYLIVFFFYFSKKSLYFIMLSFLIQIILTFFRNHMLKFKYQSRVLRVKLQDTYFTSPSYKSLNPGEVARGIFRPHKNLFFCSLHISWNYNLTVHIPFTTFLRPHTFRYIPPLILDVIDIFLELQVLEITE